MTTTRMTSLYMVVLCLIATGCVARTSSSGGPAIPADYSALPDTMVCVVDRAAPLGLTEVPAKLRSGDAVIFTDGRVQPLADVHPIHLIAGYAGEEDWLLRGDPITLGADRFSQTGGERRIEIELLRRAGEFRGILLFSGAEDSSRPNAVYVPTAPGCIFQAYVRDDLLRQ
jgi:hypothetical protein